MMKCKKSLEYLSFVIVGSLLFAAEALAQGSDPFDELRSKIKVGIVTVSAILLSLNGGIVAAGFLFKVDFLKEWSKEHLKGMILIVAIAAASMSMSSWLSNILTKIPTLWGY